MSEAAERAGLPLDQWLKAQLLSSTGPREAADGDIGDLQRRVQELAGRIENLVAVRPDAGAAIAEQAPPIAAPLAPHTLPSHLRPAPSQPGDAFAADTLDPHSADGRLDAAIRQINERIEAMNLPRSRPAPAAAGRRIEEFDSRLDERVRASEAESRRGYRPSPMTNAEDIEAAVAEIAARQSELEAARPERRPYERPAERAPFEPARAPQGARLPGSRPERAQPERGRSDAARPEPTPSERGYRERSVVPPAPAARPALNGDALEALQRELADMREGLSVLAPRRSVDELQRTVSRLAERVERAGAGDEELRGTLLALRDMIGGLKLPEHPSILMGRIDTLARKIDIVSAKTVDGSAIARLQAQASEIRDLLGRAISNDAVRLLAEQVALLAAKVSQMAGADEAMIRSAVGGLERRMDALSERIGTPPSALSIEDIQRRLESIQQGLAAARREAPEAVAASMAAGLSDIAARIERIERPVPAPDHGPRFDALSRQITDIAAKLDSATPAARIADQLTGQLSTIERAVNDLFIQMEETRATVLANAGHRGHPGGGGKTNGASLLKREIAAIEAARAAGTSPAVAGTAFAAPPAQPASAAPLAPTAKVAPSPAPEHAAAPIAAEGAPAAATAARPTAAPAPSSASEPVFTPAPASIPKPFEPQLMRAALEELSRSPDMAVAFRKTASAPASAPQQEWVQEQPRDTVPDEPAEQAHPLPDTVADVYGLGDGGQDEADTPVPVIPPAGNDDTAPRGGAAPARTQFIAQARRAAQPATVVIPAMHSRIGERHTRKPTPWLARIRAMLLIGLCGSALAYGSWHLLGTLREGQLRASAPGTGLPATARGAGPSLEDITGSVGKSPVRPDMPERSAPPPADTPPTEKPGPSSFNLPSNLPDSIGGAALRSAALAGNPAAAFEVGRRYLEGIEVAASAVRAVDWFQLAADQGSIPAAYRLGSIYEKGTEGVMRDVARARQLYERAANAGNVRAMHNLGVLLAAGVDGQPDYREAVRWFSRAAEYGLRDSQYNLAVLYARGFGVTADLGEAWRWFSLAAARGDTEAAAKRDDVAARMDAHALAVARASVENWTPRMVDAKANGGNVQDWEQPGTPRKTASR